MIEFYKNGLYADYTQIEKLEKEFSEYTGFKYGIAVDSCTNAIKLCLEYEKPKKVSIPTMTFVSVANEILHCGAELELLDKCYVNRAYQLEGTFIYDSAHAVDERMGINRRPADKFCYSFYPTKLVPSYQGGMICTNDKKFATWARLARQMGRTGYGAHYDVKMVGWKCNMTPIQALTARGSLIKLRENPGKKHLWIETVNKREKFIKRLDAAGIGYSIHFEPIHKKTAYKHYDKGQFYYTDWLSRHTISLPHGPHIAESGFSVAYVKKMLKEWKDQWNR